MAVAIPPDLAAQASLGPDWAVWLERLPRLVAELLDEWELVVDGASMNGFGSLVLPVHDTDARDAVLKVSWDGDDEGVHEGLALQHYAGRGFVRMYRADPHRRALLLERLSTENLNRLDDVEACEVVAALYPYVHHAALPQLAPLTAYVDEWLASLANLPHSAPIPRRLVEQALHLGRDLVLDAASTGTMIHGDLHYENVLASDSRGWLVIDPKPMSGDPHYEPAPMLWNRWDELVHAGNVRAGIRRRFHTLVDTAGLDEDRAREWVVVRSMTNANWSIEDAVRLDRPLTPEEHEHITMCIATAKAVQD